MRRKSGVASASADLVIDFRDLDANGKITTGTVAKIAANGQLVEDARRAAGHGDAAASPADAGFGKALGEAVRAVSNQQARAGAAAAAYERGDTHDIVRVMVERQKASLGFEATLQVRNKLLSAYRDIMNMPV